MKLQKKKILAKEILLFGGVIIVSSIVWFSFHIYNKNIKKSNTEILIEIRKINGEIRIKTDSLNNLRSPLDLTEALKIVKPYDKFDKNGKTKYNPNKTLEIYAEYGIKIKIDPKKDSLMGVSFKNQIWKLANQRKLLELQLVSDIDVEKSIKNSIIILLIMAYPLRFLIIGAIWSMKILKMKEN